ncbi:4-alpha-glucanotransferase [Olsenella uli]
MRAKHNTSDISYRRPFGAVQVGGAVSLSIDVWDEPAATVRLRLWVDEQGELLLDMDGEEVGDHLRFTRTFEPSTPEVIWYSFNITAADGAVWRYGAAREYGCGEGAFAYGEPPSFQITVFERLRPELPEWYKGGIAYQIFPDRFARGKGWEERVAASLGTPRRGPERRLVEDWGTYPRYDRTPDGRIAVWDFYGGTLDGVREKLPYLESMGITVIYLNPIFEAASSHRYDTANYLRIDPMLGDEETFSRLCAEAGSRGISIILDGVFNHVGADSLYFNKYGNYPDGAFVSEHSRYRDWFTFNDDGSYESWWGIDDLPDVNEDSAEFRELICGRDGVVRKWLRLGARGWRLDVADELTDEFIADIKAAALAEKPDALLIGEVWEDATHKVAYGRLRHYFQGRELDGTMNYPLRHALKGYLTNHMGARELADTLESLYENYPHDATYSALNLLGSHDRIRLLTVLGDAPSPESLDDDGRYRFHLDEDHRRMAVSRLWLAALLQMTLPGVPCVYYGDEAGLEGYSDPYDRASYPWGHEDEDCRAIYRNAIAVRKTLPVLTTGDFEPFGLGDDVFGFWRRDADMQVCVLVNASLHESRTVRVPAPLEVVDDVVSGRTPKVEGGEAEVFLWPLGSSVLCFQRQRRLQAPMPRGMGVLCHITSIPNVDQPGRPGTLGEPAYRFIDYLAVSGQRYWQVLPVNPTDRHGSPYAGPSAFAGNPALMWGTPAKGEGPTAFHTDFEGTPEYRRFLEENERWLLPYATFRTIKGLLGDKRWQTWPKRYRSWSPRLARSKELVVGVQRECAVQYEFMRQWDEVRRHAHRLGIKIIGDMPMYVSADSADVWAERPLFCLDEDGNPSCQAGCPPDAFAKDGQLWGNPTYDWRAMRATGYDWWLRRFERAFRLYDYVRLDHFLGFSSYYAIPDGKGALEGAWNFGPGLELFRRAAERFGQLPVVVEDLGTVTPAVRALVAATGFPGMDVVQFYDGDPCDSYVPQPHKMVYSGTHDTQTLVGWCAERYGSGPDADGAASAADVERARRLLDVTLATSADVAIVPLQDVLLLDDRARMNVPGVAEGNWSWQADAEALAASSEFLTSLAEGSGRA